MHEMRIMVYADERGRARLQSLHPGSPPRVSTQGLHPGSPPGSPPSQRCLHLHSCACTRRNCPVTDARAHLRSSYCPVPSFLLQHLSFASAPRLCASPLCRSYCVPARLSFLFKPLRLAFVLRLRAWPLRAQKLLPPYL